MKTMKKITALMLAMACICTLLPASVWAVEYTPISPTGEMTVTEDFSGNTAMIEYVESTALTGSAPFLYADATTTGLATVTPTTIGTNDGAVSTKQNSYYGLVSGGAYQLSTVQNKGSGFLSMWVGDSETSSVVYCNGNPNQVAGTNIGVSSGKILSANNIITPYRFTGLDGKNVASIKKVSASFYVNQVTANDPDAALIYNYIDDGNFDYVYHFISGGNCYFRFGAVRTEVITLGGVQYKKVYIFSARNGSGQVNLGSGLTFTAGTNNITTTTESKSRIRVDVTAEYLEDGIKFTFSDGTNSLSVTKTDEQLQTATLTDIFSSYPRYYGSNTITLADATKKVTPSKATGIGFLAMQSDMYVDNISVTYEGEKTAQALATEFTTKYVTLLAKDSTAIAPADEEEITHALADYEIVVDAQPTAADLLGTEKGKLDAFAQALAGNAAAGYFTEYSALFAPDFAIDGPEDTVLIRKAIAAYGQENSATKAAINSKAQTDHSVAQSTVLEYYKALTDAYYFKSGVLVYDDFNLYADQSAYNTYWQDIKVADGTTSPATPSTLVDNPDGTRYVSTATNGYWTFPKTDYRGTGMLKQFKVTMKLTPNAFGDAFPKVLCIYYDKDTNSYLNAAIGNWTNNTYQSGFGFGRNNTASSNINGSRFGEITDDRVNSALECTVTITVDYEYISVDTAQEPVQNGQESNINRNDASYVVKNWINLKYTTDVVNSEGTFSKSCYNFIIPSSTNKEDVLSKNFTAGIGYEGTNPGVTFESVSYTYEKGADEYSAEFEAYAETYGLSQSDVTKDDLTDINAALAIYNGFTAPKLQAAYATEAAALNGLKKVADFHNGIPAVVTPATDINDLKAGWTALNITNTAVAADLNTAELAYEAFRPTMKSATIKASDKMESQRLRFNVTMPTLESSDAWTVKEYGVVMLPYQMLAGAELSLNTEKAVRSFVAADTMPVEFRGYLELVNDGELTLDYGVRVAARAYITYTVDGNDYTLYTENTTNGGSAANAKGVENGVAVRSAAGIAKAMAQDLVTYSDNPNLSIEATDEIADTTALNSALTTLAGLQPSNPEATTLKGNILKFVAKNAEDVEYISKNLK